MTPQLEIRFPTKALRTNNAALDLALSAEAFREALHVALQKHLPGVRLAVDIDETVTGVRITAQADEPADARAMEREAEDLVWVVRQCEDWTRMVAS